MNTETLLREHFKKAADDIELNPAPLDRIQSGVRRSRLVIGIAAAAACLVVIAGLAVWSGTGSQELVATGPGEPPGETWVEVEVSSDAGTVLQVTSTPNGGFVLLTAAQRWFSSEDGVEWSEFAPQGIPAGSEMTMVTVTGDRLVAAGRDAGMIPTMATSVDGRTWDTWISGDEATWTAVGIAANSEATVVAYLDDGYVSTVYRWTEAEGWDAVPGPEPGSQVLAIGVVDGELRAQVLDPRGGRPHRDYLSADGLVWASAPTLPIIQANKPLTTGVIPGPGGWYLTSYRDDQSHLVMRSEDGVEWVPASEQVFEFGPPALVATADGILVALPRGSDPGSGESLMSVMYSRDGEVWFEQDLGRAFDESLSLVDVAMDSGTLIVAGGDREGSGSLSRGKTLVWIADR